MTDIKRVAELAEQGKIKEAFEMAKGDPGAIMVLTEHALMWNKSKAGRRAEAASTPPWPEYQPEKGRRESQ